MNISNKDAGYFKRNFAKFQASYDQDSYLVHRDKKQQLFADVTGDVLEIGPGTGVNFPFLEGKEMHWKGIEPNPAMHAFLLAAAEKSGISAELVDGVTESIQLPDHSQDYVLSTEVLCSVKDLDRSLQEIYRVLKPGGKFLFLEHVVDKQNHCRRAVQKSVPYTPWRYFSDGCHPGRDIAQAITNAPFSTVDYTAYMQEGEGLIIRINRPHIFGWAKK